MPLNINDPSGVPYAQHLMSILGSPFQVDWVAPSKRGDEQGFYHIVFSDPRSGEVLSLNLNINLNAPSEYIGDYGGLYPDQQPEFAPEVKTKSGEHDYVLGASWQSKYVESQKVWGAYHTMFSPSESLANTLSASFQEALDRKRITGMRTNVEGIFHEMMTEGGGEKYPDVSGAALLVGPNEVPALRQEAAKSISLINVFDAGVDTPLMEQQKRLIQNRKDVIMGQEPIHGRLGQTLNISETMLQGGYGPDRESTERLVRWGEGFRNIFNATLDAMEQQVYLPSRKIAKYRTIAVTGRSIATPLGDDFRPLTPQEAKSGQMTGYRYSTADIGGRTAEQGMVVQTLFSPQYLVPGSGAYFPQAQGTQMRGAGYRSTQIKPITSDVRGLLQGKLDLQFPQGEGLIPSFKRFTYARTRSAGSTEEYQDLTAATGAQSLAVTDRALVVPRYYVKSTGVGANYNKELVRKGLYGEVSDKQLAELQKKYDMPVRASSKVSDVSIALTGQEIVDAKFAAAGIKSALDPRSGIPTISAGGQSFPYSHLTFESKVAPEMYMGSFAAQAPIRQYSMLREYAATQGPERVEQVSQFIRSLRTQRSADPRTRFDWQEFGDIFEQPAMEVAKDMYVRQFMGGWIDQPGGERVSSTSTMTETELETFAQSPKNVSNLQRYRTGWVAPGMASTLNLSTAERDVAAQRDASVAYQMRTNKGMTLEQATDLFYTQSGYDRPTTEGGLVNRQISPYGFTAPLFGAVAAEWSGGKEASMEELLTMYQKAPEMMSRLGGSLANMGPAAVSRNVTPVNKAWGEIAQLTMMSRNMLKGGLPMEPRNPLMISKAMAVEMSGDPEVMGALPAKGLTQERLSGLQGILQRYFPDEKNVGRRPIGFEGVAGQFMPSIQSILRVGLPTSTGEDVTRHPEIWRKAFTETLESTSMGDEMPAQQAMYRMFGHFEKEFGLDTGKPSPLFKKMFGSDIPRTSGRYSYSGELEQQQIYGSEELWRSAIRQSAANQGINISEEEVQQAYNFIAGDKSTMGKAPQYVRTQGVPVMAGRFPIYAGESSALAVQALTPEHLKRMGITVPPESGLTEKFWRVGLGISTMLGGDLDLDPMWVAAGLQFERGREGELRLGFAGLGRHGKPEKRMRDEMAWLRNANIAEVQNLMFPNQALAQEYDPNYQAAKDRGVMGMAGVAALFEKQNMAAKWYGYGELTEGLELYSGAKQQMGMAYNYTRAIEASAAVGGWETEQIMLGRQGRAAMYTPHLDIKSSIPSPLVNMFYTSFLSKSEKGTTGLGWAMPVIDPKNRELQWTSRAGYTNRLTTENMKNLQTRMAMTAIQPFFAQGAAAYQEDIAQTTGMTPAQVMQAVNDPKQNQKRYQSVLAAMQEGGAELPTPATLAFAFAPEASRMYTGTSRGKETPEQSNERRLAYQNLLKTRTSGQITATQVREAEQQLYSGMGLYEALLSPYEEKDTDIFRRAANVRKELKTWTEVNYGDRPEMLAQGNLFRAMTGKGLASAVGKDVNFQPTESFRQSELGEQITGQASLFGPAFKILKGIFPEAQEAVNLEQHLTQLDTKSTTGTGIRGFLRNLLGFRSEKPTYSMADFDFDAVQEIPFGQPGQPIQPSQASTTPQPTPAATTRAAQPTPATPQPTPQTAAATQQAQQFQASRLGAFSPGGYQPGGGNRGRGAGGTPAVGGLAAASNMGGGELPPTDVVNQFYEGYKVYGEFLENAAVQLRTAVGGITGVTPGPGEVAGVSEAFGLTPELRKQILPQFQEAARIARQLSGQAIRARKAYPQAEQTKFPADMSTLMERAISMNEPTAQGLYDLMEALPEAKGARKTGAQIDPSVLSEHMTRLGETFFRVGETFAVLDGATKKTIEQVTDYNSAVADNVKAAKELDVSKAAAGLVEAGVLQPIAGRPGRYTQLTGAVPVGMVEDLAKYQAQAVDLQKMETTQAGAPGADTGGGNGIQRLLRRTLGGFGIMYMRSLWNIMTGGLGAGQGERVGLDQMLAGEAAQATGGIALPYNQLQAIKNQTALGGAAYNPVLALQGLTAQNPMLRDLRTGIGAGVGAYAFMQQMGMWGGEESFWGGLATKGLKIGGANISSGMIAGSIGLAAVGVSALSNLRDTEGLAYRSSKLGQGGLGAITTAVSMDTPSHLLAMAFDEKYRKQLELYDYARKTAEGGWSFDQLTQGPTVLEGPSGRAGVGSAVGAAMTKEEQAQFLTAQTRIDVERFPEYAPEVTAAVRSFATRNKMGLTEPMFRRFAEQWQLGIGGEKAVSGLLGTFGYNQAAQQAQPYQAQGIDQTVLADYVTAMAINPPSQQQMAMLTSGANVVSSFGQAAYYMPGLGAGATRGVPPSYETLMTTLPSYAKLEGTPAQAVAQQLMQNWYKQAQYGGEAKFPVVQGMEQYQPEQLFKVQLGALAEAQKPDYTVALAELLATRFAGVQAGPPEDAGGLARALMEGARTPEEQAGVLKRYQTIAGLNQMRQERFDIQPSQEYITRVSAMKQPEIDIESERQAIIDSIQTTMLEQGMAPDLTGAKVAQLQQEWDVNKIRGQGDISGIADKLSRGMALSWGLGGQERMQEYTQLTMRGEQLRTPFYQQMLSGIQQFEPYALTQGYAYGEQMPGGGQIPGWMASRDIWGPTAPEFLQGQPLNAPAFTVSGASNPLFGMLRANMGANFNWQSNVGQAFAKGYTVPGTNITAAGMTGAQNYMMVAQAQAQTASAGVAAQQLALTREYTPQFWAMQDQMTQMGYGQQMWQFGQQRQGQEMQSRQFYEGFNLNQQQMGMQRQWTREDWGTQDQTRAMQRGWRVEDFQENLRFMTGRDRRLAERGMERETIMYGKETEQIDRQRERQEQLWQLEDERNDMQVRQFEENRKFQEEAINKQQEYYQSRYELELQLTELQREYQEKQWDLQEQSIGVQAKLAEDAKAYAEIQAGINLTMLQNATLMESVEKNGRSFVEILDEKIKSWIKMMGGQIWVPPSNNQTPSWEELVEYDPITGEVLPPAGSTAWGDMNFSEGQSSWVGETGPEILTATRRGFYSQKRGEIRPTLYDPWDTQQIGGHSQFPEQKQPVTIIVNVGDEELKRYIVKAAIEGLS